MTRRIFQVLKLLALFLSGNVGVVVAQDTTPEPDEPPTTSEDSATVMFRRVLSELEELSRTDSLEYQEQRAILVVAAQMALARMGFGPTVLNGRDDSATREAVRAFQAARGMGVTGEILAPVTWTRIVGDADRLAKAQARPRLPEPVFGSDRWSEGYVMARGPWISDEVSSVDQAVSIECRRERLECRIVYAELGRGGVGGRTLRPDLESYRIARWEDREIVSHPLEYPCVRYVLRLDRDLKAVSLTRSTVSTEGTCSYLTDSDLTARLGTSAGAMEADERLRILSDSLLNLSPRIRALLRARHSNR